MKDRTDKGWLAIEVLAYVLLNICTLGLSWLIKIVIQKAVFDAMMMVNDAEDARRRVVISK